MQQSMPSTVDEAPPEEVKVRKRRSRKEALEQIRRHYEEQRKLQGIEEQLRQWRNRRLRYPRLTDSIQIDIPGQEQEAVSYVDNSPAEGGRLAHNKSVRFNLDSSTASLLKLQRSSVEILPVHEAAKGRNESLPLIRDRRRLNDGKKLQLEPEKKKLENKSLTKSLEDGHQNMGLITLNQRSTMELQGGAGAEVKTKKQLEKERREKERREKEETRQTLQMLRDRNCKENIRSHQEYYNNMKFQTNPYNVTLSFSNIESRLDTLVPNQKRVRDPELLQHIKFKRLREYIRLYKQRLYLVPKHMIMEEDQDSQGLDYQQFKNIRSKNPEIRHVVRDHIDSQLQLISDLGLSKEINLPLDKDPKPLERQASKSIIRENHLQHAIDMIHSKFKAEAQQEGAYSPRDPPPVSSTYNLLHPRAQSMDMQKKEEPEVKEGRQEDEIQLMTREAARKARRERRAKKQSSLMGGIGGGAGALGQGRKQSLQVERGKSEMKVLSLKNIENAYFRNVGLKRSIMSNNNLQSSPHLQYNSSMNTSIDPSVQQSLRDLSCLDSIYQSCGKLRAEQEILGRACSSTLSTYKKKLQKFKGIIRDSKREGSLFQKGLDSYRRRYGEEEEEGREEAVRRRVEDEAFRNLYVKQATLPEIKLI